MAQTVKEWFNRVYKFASMGAGFDSRVQVMIDGRDIDISSVAYFSDKDLIVINLITKNKE